MLPLDSTSRIVVDDHLERHKLLLDEGLTLSTLRETQVGKEQILFTAV